MAMDEEYAKKLAIQQAQQQCLPKYGDGGMINGSGYQQRNPSVREALTQRQSKAYDDYERTKSALATLPEPILAMDIYEFYRLIGV